MTEEEIFAAAIEIDDPAARNAFLDETCPADGTLRAAVDELLALHDTADGFLETPALGHAPLEEREEPGATIGRYRLVERVGEGGFGVVWRAEQQEPVRRDVALKIIRPGMDTDRIIARFEAERQTLAIMNHPNIAMVLDAGTLPAADDHESTRALRDLDAAGTQRHELRGRPYFVMELVNGQSIDDYCRQNKLGLRERLSLFAEVCLAVHHAHQKGIVHRDLKPSNILVQSVDGRAVPKVIDFGIAKVICGPADTVRDGDLSGPIPLHEVASDGATQGGSDGTADRMRPEFPTERHLVGTPGFMSPEQLTGDADIDTRADVFALAAVLYKLLAGTPPLDPATVKAGDPGPSILSLCLSPPTKPSVRLAEDMAASSAFATDVSPRDIEGDLDAIVMKGLAGDRSERYESTAELARDIQRHLACQPVAAATHTRRYRASKFVKRNRVWVFATTLAVMAVTAGTVAALAGYLRADRARRNAAELRRQAALKVQVAEYQRAAAQAQSELARAKADEALRMAAQLEQIVSGASPRKGKRADFNLRQVLDEFATSVADDFADHPETEARLRRTIGRAYLDLIEIRTAGPHLKRALELRRKLFSPTHPSVLESRVDYASFLIADSRLDEAELELQQALPALRRGEPTAALIRALASLSRLRQFQESFKRAAELAEEAWVLAVEVHGPTDVVTYERQSRKGYLTYLAVRYTRDEDTLIPPAEKQIREALTNLKQRWPERRFEINSASVSLARVLAYRGETAEARPLMEQVIAERRETLGEDSKYLVTDLVVMSRIQRAEGNLDGAEKTVRRAIEMASRLTDERERIRGHAFYQLSAILEDDDQPEEAAKWHARAIDAWHTCLGNHLTVAIQRRRLAEQLRSLGRWPEAEKALKQSLAVLTFHPDRVAGVAMTHHRIADLLRTIGKREEAVAHLQKSIPLQQVRKIASTVAYIDCIEILIELGRVDEADKLGQAWRAAAEQASSSTPKIMARVSEAQLMMANGDYQSAADLLQQTFERLHIRLPRMRARARGLLAKCQVQMGSFESAESILLEQANDPATELHPLEPRRVARQLVELYEAWGQIEKADQWREPAA